MKKNFLMLLLGGAMLMPTTMMAQSGGPFCGDDEKPGQHRSPAHNQHAYITYDENSGVANITFLTACSNAEIILLQDGIQVDCQSLDVDKGAQVPIYLPTYGSGEFIIQVKSGSTLVATYYTTL